MRNKRAFTLLELLIVIIIIGVLTSLSLPQLISLVEASRSAEALASFSSIRQGMERCYLMKGTFVGCLGEGTAGPDFHSYDFSNLGLDNPGNSPGAHFTYKGSIFKDEATGKECWWFAAKRIDEKGDPLYGDGCYFLIMSYGVNSYNFWRDKKGFEGYCDGYYNKIWDDKIRFQGQPAVSVFLPKVE